MYFLKGVKNMFRYKFYIAALVFSLGSFSASAFAGKCSYCPELVSLKKSFGSLKADSMDEETIDQQNALVDRASALAATILAGKKNLPKDDLERLIELMVIAAPFDAQHFIAEENLKALKPHLGKIYAELERLTKAGKFTADQAERLEVALDVAAEEAEFGNDPAGSRDTGATKEKPKKRAKR